MTMMALGFPMQLVFEILGQPYFPFFLVFCELARRRSKSFTG